MRELITAAAPVTADLRAAGPDVQTAAKATRTIVEALPEDLSNLLDWVRNAALATAGHDGISHYLRIFALATGKEVGPSEPPAGAGRPARRRPRDRRRRESPARSCPSSPPAGTAPIGSLFGAAGSGGLLGGGLDSVLGGKGPAADPGSATGLTERQERSLLRYLLGAG